jgi:fructosamine-3-kinase
METSPDMIREFEAISDRLGHRPGGKPTPVSGGCIHTSHIWSDWFIKTTQTSAVSQFAAEAKGLQALARTRTIRVPEVILHDRTETTAFLVLERLELQSSGDQAALGDGLAALHDHSSERFGFDEDNYIGATLQPNPWTPSWPEFFTRHRIAPLLHRLEAKGSAIEHAATFLDRLPGLLPENPPASLIHGDLWSGNKAFLADGSPVVFDPAAHHADPECDLAMTTLFGGFSEDFYEAYRARRPAPDDLPRRHELYRLYHVLNHALLFGGGYHAEAAASIDRLL